MEAQAFSTNFSHFIQNNILYMFKGYKQYIIFTICS